MNPKEFDDYLGASLLSNEEKREAWEIYKKENPFKAIRFVNGIETNLSKFRKQATLRADAVPYKIWGEEYIEEGALSQMEAAARLPVALAGALMPDAHQGYGLPIGGVLATDNAVIPYAVGVDIACRMMLTVYPQSPDTLNTPTSPEYQRLYNALLKNTIFGAGPQGAHEGKIEHAVLDKAHWQISNLTRNLRDTAIHQLGTSGGGNHFVEWGSLEITDPHNPLKLKLGHYLALLSHSGSRGVGFQIANHFTTAAMKNLPNLDSFVKHLAWLSLDHDQGREYWKSMELAGEFASANHHIIHERVAKAAGLIPVGSIENHHNFAWKEKIIVEGQEKEAIVHRKGATPAGKGVLGIIPGTMADPGYIVVGKGNEEGLNSASHGSGRKMARTQAKKTITTEQHKDYLKNRGIDLIGGGLDEAPQAYKEIDKVIKFQDDLVDVIGKFQPRIVRMASDKNDRVPRRAQKNIFEGE